MLFLTDYITTFFFYQSFLMDTDDSQESWRREGAIFIRLYHFYPFNKHSDYRVFLIALHIITRLLLDEVYRVWKVEFD